MWKHRKTRAFSRSTPWNAICPWSALPATTSISRFDGRTGRSEAARIPESPQGATTLDRKNERLERLNAARAALKATWPLQSTNDQAAFPGQRGADVRLAFNELTTCETVFRLAPKEA
jgi:hypothetical protein